MLLAGGCLPRAMERRFPSCFVSCSFGVEDADVVSWFERIHLALDFDPKKADVPQPRPPPEKIAAMIQTADCFVAIVTKRTKVEGSESWIGPEWVQNEIGMAYQAGKPMAIFVEEGVDAKGIGPWAADYVSFSRGDLGANAPNIVRYLVNLRRTVIGVRTGGPEEVPTARALANELANFASMIAIVEKPTSLPWQMAYMTARFTGRFYMLPAPVQQKVAAAYSAIGTFEELVTPSFSLRKAETFPPDQVEQIKEMKDKIGDILGEAVLELLQFGYPEELGALVDAIKKGQMPPRE